MLYSVAIMKRAAHDDIVKGAVAEELIYGPVNIICGESDYNAVGNKVIAQAAIEGKLPGGWTDRMYVCGTQYAHFT
jgi:hypothetical protein